LTVVALWYEEDPSTIWCAADTRISQRGSTGGRIVLTDSGAKIFASPLVCRKPTEDPRLKSTPFYYTSFGFACAGSTLPAVMTVSTASTFLQDLIAPASTLPPALIQVADLVRKLGARFMNELWSSKNFSESLFVDSVFEAVVFGYCPRSDSFQVIRLTPKNTQNKLSVVMDTRDIKTNRETIIFGSGCDRLKATIDRMKIAGIPGRIQKQAIQTVIDEESDAGVGGSLSLGLATRTGFIQCWAAQPTAPGAPNFWRNFNGIDIDAELGTIGPCVFGGMGMA
jgi:hypothetical protein